MDAREIVGAIAKATLLLLAASAGPAWAQSTVVPSPKAVIYPGDIIEEGSLGETTLEARVVGGPFALSTSELAGKAAAQTLLPGKPIPLRAVNNPRVIRNGGEVKMLYVDGGLSIVTTGSALQDGFVGDMVKVRNLDSGVTVSGRARADGVVLVSGG